jgi:SAM-dependent methyltransferase
MSKSGEYEDKPFIAELYDYVPFYSERADVDFYVSFAKAGGGRVLELGCGTGRILIPTAAAECEITGLDFSVHMLAKCRQKLKSHPQEVQKHVQLVHCKMAEFNLNDTFSLMTAPFRSFQHLLSVEEQLTCLKCANHHLRLGGMFVFDVSHVHLRFVRSDDYAKEMEDFSNIELPEGKKMRRTHRIVASYLTEQYNEVELIYYVTYPNGQVNKLVQAFPFRYFFRYEIEHLLARCGFKVIDMFGNFDQSPLKYDSPEMIFVAEKVKTLKDCENGYLSAERLKKQDSLSGTNSSSS